MLFWTAVCLSSWQQFSMQASGLNGWLFIDGGGNRPDFDIELAKNVDLPVIPFRASEEDIDSVAQSLSAIPKALAWPTNSFAVKAAQYLLDGLGKAFPQRIISPPIPFVNSISDLLAATLTSPSTSVRHAARRAFETVSDYYDAHVGAENLAASEAASA